MQESEEISNDITNIDACITCLSDDAADMHTVNPDDEVADNMLRAMDLLNDMSLLLKVCRTALEDECRYELMRSIDQFLNAS